ncbi:MAG: hypothetical protein JJT78_00985, partial [Leptospira sp.]|nr:hypothetical protein [Leptospira sp.]
MTFSGGCETAPDGMVCIPKGDAVIGSTAEEIENAISETKLEIEDRQTKLKSAKSRSERADLLEEINFMKSQIGMIRTEAPRTKVFLDTFYIDKNEVTNKDYFECVKA